MPGQASASGSRTYLNTPSRVQIQPGTPVGEDGGVFCSGHKRRAVKRTAGPHTKNAGRHFYACPLKQDDEIRCKFFKWEDEINVTPNAPATPRSITKLVANPKPAPIDEDIDWSQVDTDALERDAIASTPSSSQSHSQTPATHTTPFNNRLQALADDSRKRKREDDTPRAENPFLSSQSLHPSLSDISDHLHRQDRLLAASEKAKEGFRKTIKQRDEKIKDQEEMIRTLRQRLGEA